MSTGSPQHFGIVMLGEGGVGKSCLTINFISGRFLEDYDPTMEDSYRRQVTIDGQECMLDITDTAGQEGFTGVRDQYMKTGDGFLCVYSIVDKKTFDIVKEHHDSVMRVKWETDDFPFVLVGNKSDMEDHRQVTHEMGVKMAKDLNVKFLETSAKTGKNVHEAFHEIVREIKKWRQLHPNTSAKTAASPTEKKKKRGRCNIV